MSALILIETIPAIKGFITVSTFTNACTITIDISTGGHIEGLIGIIETLIIRALANIDITDRIAGNDD
ncbi:MAG: hypothetical protein V3R54_08875 [Thermodesulfovibrionia bacterium]